MEEIELLDIADDLLIINKITIEKLFKEENQNALVLYLFYYKTAKWQKCNPIKANDDYCKKCLHWGIDKLQATKKRLKKLKLIEIVKRKGEKGKIQGWFVKVNYLVDISTIPKTTIPITPQLDSQETNTNKITNINTNNNKNNTTTNTIFDFLEENGFVLTPLHYEIIKTWEDTELTRYAIKKAVLNNKFNINYIQKILNSYKKENIKTVQQAVESDEAFERRRSNYYKNKYSIRESQRDRERRLMEEYLNEEE